MIKVKSEQSSKTNIDRQRMGIMSSVDKLSGKEVFEVRKHTVRLSETEIAILKGALQYWLLDHDFGYELWAIQIASFSTHDEYYKWIVTGRGNYKGLYEVLNDLCPIEPNFGGYWGDINRLTKEFNKILTKTGTQARKFEKEYGLSMGDSMSLSDEELEKIKNKRK